MKKTIIISILVVIFLLGCTNSPSPQNNSVPSIPTITQKTVETTETGETKTTETNPIFQTVTFEDENGTVKITKNLITKTAEIDYQSRPKSGNIFDNTFLTTLLTCGILQQIIYDPTKYSEWIKDWNQKTKEWNQSAGENTSNDLNGQDVSDSVNQKLGLENYTVTNLHVTTFESDTGNKVGECTITGKENNQRQFTFYGKYAADYEEYQKNNASDNNSGIEPVNII